MDRVPLNTDEIELLKRPELDEESCSRLLSFYKKYHERNLVFFLAVRERWHRENPGQFFPGLCANVNPITGEFRPASDQKLWGWGDSRALGIWSSFLAAGRVPDRDVEIEGKSFNLKSGIEEYVEIIREGLEERIRLNGGVVPFTADYRTHLADDNPKNRPEGKIDFTSNFAAGGFFQYGLYRKNEEAVALGKELFDRVLRGIEQTDNSRGPDDAVSHGPRMISLGVIVDVLKTVSLLPMEGSSPFIRFRDSLLETALPFIEYILNRHFRDEPPAFWEMSRDGRPAADPSGCILVDPGHATECAGFLAELVPFLPESWHNGEWGRQRVLEAAVKIHIFADEIGFVPTGVMIKFADLLSREALPDTQAGVQIPTAPWWNVREHCAAALRLYTLTGDVRLLETYRKAQNASYLHYPNGRIGGQMVQTIDPYTLEPLDVAPATGNLDPMHDPRARLREIENLEIILGEE